MPTNFDQGEFNFDAPSNENGYALWKKELDDLKKDIESQWGIILGSRVRVSLRGYAGPKEGVMQLMSEKPLSDTPPMLRIGDLTFQADLIESCIRLDD